MRDILEFAVLSLFIGTVSFWCAVEINLGPSRTLLAIWEALP